MPSLVSFISLAVRGQCEEIIDYRVNDRIALKLCLRFFNSFLMEAIEKKNDRAFHNVLYQYIQLAKHLSKIATDLLPSIFCYFEVLSSIFFYFDYYLLLFYCYYYCCVFFVITIVILLLLLLLLL